MLQLPPSWKICVTCERWAGPRKASVFRDNVEYSDDSDKGECVGGVFDRQQMSANSTCNKWVKWAVLQ